MNHRVRVAVLLALSGLLAVWLFAATDSTAAQRREDVPIATQAAIERSSNVSANAIIRIEGELRRITDVATDAREEVRSLRNALWGLASVILVSLLMQAVQIKKDRERA